MRLYLVEPYHDPAARRVVVAPNPDEACRYCGVLPGHARVKDQTRFALRQIYNPDQTARRAVPTSEKDTY